MMSSSKGGALFLYAVGRASYRNFSGSPPPRERRQPGISRKRPQNGASSTACDPHAGARIDEEVQPSISEAQPPGGLAASQPDVNHDDEASFNEEMPSTRSAPYVELEDPSSQSATTPLERLSNDQLLVFSVKV
ncbi:hypothetical protein ANCCAN_21214 [Ancylostoma caninum]|uniref:Uncharacterized protein n=1 Tax=Ancylostoma caninum TaxID=29170 RepID=A0A368FL72_ANCCA|nr:hypothetical protein ANCCAN_21214 [Ancylostoma caninum]